MPELTVPQMQAMAADIAASVGISIPIFLRLISQESRWDPNIVNNASGCTGLCQLHPRYYGKEGDLTDPRTNLTIGARELKYLLFALDNSWFLALAYWNHGWGNILKLKDQYGDDWAMYLPGETKSMIDIVLLGAEPKKALATWRGR